MIVNDKLYIEKIECTTENPLKSVLLQILSDMTKDVEFNYFKDTLPYRGVYLDISCEYNLCNMLIDIKECLIIIFKGLFKYIYDAIDKTIQISVKVTNLLQEK